MTDRPPIPTLSLTQPWAQYVALAEKRVETRSWRTHHRGLLAIHAAKKAPTWATDLMYQDETMRRLTMKHGLHGTLDLPTGCVVALARLLDVVPTESVWSGTDGPADGEMWLPYGPNDQYAYWISDQEYHLGDYRDRRYAWFLTDIRPLPKPIPVRGALNVWPWSAPAMVWDLVTPEERVLMNKVNG